MAPRRLGSAGLTLVLPADEGWRPGKSQVFLPGCPSALCGPGDQRHLPLDLWVQASCCSRGLSRGNAAKCEVSHSRCKVTWAGWGGGPGFTPALPWSDHFPGKRAGRSCGCWWLQGEAACLLGRTLGSAWALSPTPSLDPCGAPKGSLPPWRLGRAFAAMDKPVVPLRAVSAHGVAPSRGALAACPGCTPSSRAGVLLQPGSDLTGGFAPMGGLS